MWSQHKQLHKNSSKNKLQNFFFAEISCHVLVNDSFHFVQQVDFKNSYSEIVKREINLKHLKLSQKSPPGTLWRFKIDRTVWH